MEKHTLTSKELKEKLKTGELTVGKKGRITQRKPRQENMLKGKHAVRQSAQRKEAVKCGYRSSLEKRVAEILTTHGIKFEYEQEKIQYTIQPNVKCTCLDCGSSNTIENREYLIDFTAREAIIEVKGLLSPKDRKKMLEVRKSTDRRIIILFQNPNTDLYNKSKKEIEARKKSKTPRRTYAGWATANGFEVATIKSIIYVLNNKC
jgi:Fe-S oxidoreductase